MTLRIIVNADDFGLTRGVSESIVACHAAGAVTSTSFMVNMDGSEHAAGLAHAAPRLGVGLHFNLTLGRPVSSPEAVPSLVDRSGRFLTRGALLRRWATGRLDASNVRTELHAQLARMRAWGVEPTHFDSHQHVHAIPAVFRVLAGQAHADGKAVRVTWRWPGTVAGKSLARRGNEFALARLTSHCLARKPPGLRINTGLCSVFDLQSLPETLDASSYEKLLAAYEAGTVELMVHPAVVDAELEARTAITRVSAAEDRLLRTDLIPCLVAARGARLATYADA